VILDARGQGLHVFVAESVTQELFLTPTTSTSRSSNAPNDVRSAAASRASDHRVMCRR